MKIFNILGFSAILLSSSLSLSSRNYVCLDKKTGLAMDLVTLMESSGLDGVNSMENTLGKEIYGKYLAFTNKAMKKFPFFGLVMKSVSRFRWIPTYKFNCDVEKERSQYDNIFEKTIAYSQDSWFGPSFYVNHDLNDSSFGSSKVDADKKRILAIINEALRRH